VTGFNLGAELARLNENQLYRRRRSLGSPQGKRVVVDGRALINFCSNDYLGLANHPFVVNAMQEAASNYGVGSGASHLVCGHSHEHHALEEELADWLKRPRALLYSTGYMANLGIITALLGRGDAVFEDSLNHASLIEGGMASKADYQRYAHLDMDELGTRLHASSAPRKLMVTDSVFSMDGDVAPLPDMMALATRHDAWVMVDDAHALGVLGATGAGSAEHFGLRGDAAPQVIMGTLGKALGSFGAFVAGSEELIEFLINRSRSYIFTTALPPAVAAATRMSVKLARQEGWRREKLRVMIAQLRSGLIERGYHILPSDTPVQALILGESSKALALSAALAEQGYWVGAIRPPTVPAGTARLRITLTAAHDQADVAGLLRALDVIGEAAA